jgi:AcrR family transcriptional regulator
MTIVLDRTGADTRARILLTAERLFRDIGYQKTTVADIAKLLKMSPANVYRFFESKRAIHEAVACRLMGEIEQAATAIAEKPLSATQRLRELLMTIHHLNKERYVGDSKLHEMVAIAMQEDWKACHTHLEFIGATVGKVVVDGMERGEFKAADPMTTALCVVSAMVRFFYPQIIAQCAVKPRPTVAQMVDFVIGSISAAKASGYPRS